MWEFFQEMISIVNLPFTILLGVVIVYWLMVVFGILGVDAFDVDMDVDPGLDIDADMDGSFDADSHGETGFSIAALKFFHFGEIPIMLIVSVFVLCLWLSSMIVNHYFNHEVSWMLALLLLGPNIVISLIISKLILLPIVPIFRLMSSGEAARLEIVGKTCLITTAEVSEKFGQAEIPQDGPPVVINVCVAKGDHVSKGDAAIVYAYDAEKDAYRVRPVSSENR
jgi:hypothetical protein